MSQHRKHRGMKTQALVAEHLRAQGWPWATSTGAGRPGADVENTPDIAVEVKATADWNPVGWLKQAEKNADGRLPFAVSRPNGIGENPGQYIAHVRLADLLPLLHAAGYGDPKGRT